jgi:hypothetical protein
MAPLCWTLNHIYLIELAECFIPLGQKIMEFPGFMGANLEN